MGKSKFILAATLSFIMFVLFFQSPSQQILAISANAACTGCSDSIKDCKKPRDFNSADPVDGCACFDCEKGTPNQHLKCTKDEVDKKTMFALIEKEKRGIPDDEPTPAPR